MYLHCTDGLLQAALQVPSRPAAFSFILEDHVSNSEALISTTTIQQPGQPCCAQCSEKVSSAHKGSRKLGNQNLDEFYVDTKSYSSSKLLTLTLVPVLLQLANPTRWSLLPSSVLYFNDYTGGFVTLTC